MRLPTGLRDSPVALAAMAIGVVCVILALGCLTVRIGSAWTRAYIHRQIQTDK